MQSNLLTLQLNLIYYYKETEFPLLHTHTLANYTLNAWNERDRNVHHLETSLSRQLHWYWQWKKHKPQDEHSIECITHAGHSIAFDMFLHFVTLWPWVLDIWPNINWLVRTRDGLSLWQVWWLWFQPFGFYRVERQTDTQTWLNDLLLQLSSAWVTITIQKYHTDLVT